MLRIRLVHRSGLEIWAKKVRGNTSIQHLEKLLSVLKRRLSDDDTARDNELKFGCCNCSDVLVRLCDLSSNMDKCGKRAFRLARQLVDWNQTDQRRMRQFVDGDDCLHLIDAI